MSVRPQNFQGCSALGESGKILQIILLEKVKHALVLLLG